MNKTAGLEIHSENLPLALIIIGGAVVVVNIIVAILLISSIFNISAEATKIRELLERKSE